jgi:hypothetical protein
LPRNFFKIAVGQLFWRCFLGWEDDNFLNFKFQSYGYCANSKKIMDLWDSA